MEAGAPVSRTRTFFLGLILVALTFALAGPARAVACGGAVLSTGGCLFTITGGDTADTTDGFPVTNTADIPVWDFYRNLNLQKVGYPISQRWTNGPFTLQAFQKIILQWDEANQRFNYYNTLDVLQNAYGVNLPNVPAHAVLPEDAGAPFAQIVENHLALLDQNPKIKAAFLAESDWLNLFGLPIAYEEREVNGNPQGLQLLRAQRIVFEVWNVPAPGTSLGAVGRQNVPDKVKKLDNVIIPNAAKQPVTRAVAESLAPPPTVQPATGLTGYGVQGEFRRPNDGALADLIRGAGLNWVKQQIAWQEVENLPGLYFWDDADRFVNTMNGRGLNILMSVVKSPDFYKDDPAKIGTTHGRPKDPTKLRTFMRDLASRYRGRVQAYEIWNEENLSLEWGSFSSASYGQFVELMKQGYIGVKEGDPNAIVVLGAPTPTGVNNRNIAIDDLTYLQRVFAHNGGEVANYFEVLGVHPNGGPNAPDDTRANPAHTNANCGGGWSTHDSFFFNRYTQLYDAMVRAGITGKTVWLTEFGWASIDGPGAPGAPARGYEYAACNTEQHQAAFITRAFEKVRAETPYVTHMIVWNLNFQQVVPNTDEKWAFGIIRADGSPRPAFTALKNMPKPQPGGGVAG